MYEQVEKPKKNKSRTLANTLEQQKSDVRQGFRFVDNRSLPILQRLAIKGGDDNANTQKVKKAAEAAGKRILDVAKILGEIKLATFAGSTVKVKSQIEKYFQTTQHDQFKSIVDKMKTNWTYIDGNTEVIKSNTATDDNAHKGFRYVDENKGSTIAGTIRNGNNTRISVYKNGVGESDNYLMVTLIHELAHSADSSVNDIAYAHNKLFPYLNDPNFGKAPLQNAESYAFAIIDVVGKDDLSHKGAKVLTGESPAEDVTDLFDIGDVVKKEKAKKAVAFASLVAGCSEKKDFSYGFFIKSAKDALADQDYTTWELYKDDVAFNNTMATDVTLSPLIKAITPINHLTNVKAGKIHTALDNMEEDSGKVKGAIGGKIEIWKVGGGTEFKNSIDVLKVNDSFFSNEQPLELMDIVMKKLGIADATRRKYSIVLALHTAKKKVKTALKLW